MFWWHTFAMIRRQMPQTPFPEKGNIIFLPWLWSRSAKNDILKNCFWKRQILKKSISVVFFNVVFFRHLSFKLVYLDRDIAQMRNRCLWKTLSWKTSISAKQVGPLWEFFRVIIPQWFIFLPSNQGHDLVSLNTWCFIRGAPRVTP